MTIGRRAMVGAGLGALLVLLPARPARAGERAAADGGYGQHCAACHGERGRGDGPDAALFTPRPRDLHQDFLARFDTEALVRTVREGTPLSLALTPAALTGRADEVEQIIAYMRRLPTVDWDRAERGEELWVARCESCHGRYGEPPPTLPAGVRRARDLSDLAFQRGIEDRELVTVVRHGRRGMPALPDTLDDADAGALVAWVRLLSPGFRLYGRFCSACHGDDGRADELVDPGMAPRAVFDRAYFAKKDPEALRTKVWHMLAGQRPAMPHFRTRLTERQARAIVEYLKRTQ